ncbi:hypothetical protein HYPSUDRAFT_40564 [Hypholoma sublateritium FD-334 SS-4]|uniref:BTB domain-containing protein n=1 Tax=Hypholoma sublateritium (strain FD-334 SS-4) TaxID=945553 RepID=A0A0D2MGM0_HYPSF|nr:hypothetical protein HYPSUDRAFT_40564 [Hypholoma sublateritium FD-334 SS-4]
MEGLSCDLDLHSASQMAYLQPSFVITSSQNHDIYGYNATTCAEYHTQSTSFPVSEYSPSNQSDSGYHDFGMVSELSHNNSLSPPLWDGSTHHGPHYLEDTLVTLPQDDVVSISTSFHPQNCPQPETVLVSSDNVLFYVHSPTLLAACPTAFEAYMTTSLSREEYRTRAVHIDATANQLNVILHTLHRTSPAANAPDFDTLVTSIDHMPRYGISPRRFIRPMSLIHELLLSYAPLRPLDLYALGAHHKIPSLAVSSSSQLLSWDLTTITDSMAERIGAVYLKKLMLLHVDRNTTLRNIILHSPNPHPSTKECNFNDQRSLTRAWALVIAYLAWEAKPDLSTYSIRAALTPLLENVSCKLCHQVLQARIMDVMAQWASGKHAGTKFGSQRGYGQSPPRRSSAALCPLRCTPWLWAPSFWL